LPAASDAVADATGPSGAAVSFPLPTASDTGDGVVAVTCDHATGSTFAIGTTVVACVATDNHGNSATSSFQVTVRNTRPPVIGKVPGTDAQNQLIAFATSLQGATVNYTNPRATDSAGRELPVNCPPASGTRFAAGQTTV